MDLDISLVLARTNPCICIVVFFFCRCIICPLLQINRKSHYFPTDVVYRSDKVPKASIAPFFHFLIIVLKLPVCSQTAILKGGGGQTVFKLLLLPAFTLHLNRVMSTFSFTCVTIDAVIYTACYCSFQFFFLLLVFFSLELDP